MYVLMRVCVCRLKGTLPQHTEIRWLGRYGVSGGMAGEAEYLLISFRAR